MPSAKAEDLTSEEPPSNINPYEVLGVDRTATGDQIKTAYRKQALKHHPDKAPPESRPTAHTRFQEIALAYAILSEPRRRSRYDTTGRTDESLDLDDDDFNWTDYFRNQYTDIITSAALDKFKAEYQKSEEERRDVLQAYENAEGDMDGVFEEVMLSNPLADEDRFRTIIDDGIKKGEIQAFDKYTKESKAQRKKRAQNAKREEQEARELAEELGVADKLFGNGEVKKGKAKGKSTGEDELAALIQQRGKQREQNFLERLEEKYAPKGKGKGKRSLDEPSEEAFQKNAKKGKKRAENPDDQDPPKRSKKARKA